MPAAMENEPRESRARVAWAVAALTLLLAAFLGDTFTGEEVSFSFFYVVGVVVASWYLGRNAGFVAAACSVAAWIGAYVIVGKPYSRPSTFYWNVIVEAGIYVTVALSVARARDGLARERDLRMQLGRANEVLDRFPRPQATQEMRFFTDMLLNRRY